MLSTNLYDDFFDVVFFNDFERICKKAKEELDSNKGGKYSDILKRYFPQLEKNKEIVKEKTLDTQQKQMIEQSNKLAFKNVSKLFDMYVKQKKDLYISMASILFNTYYDIDKLQEHRAPIKYIIFHDVTKNKEFATIFKKDIMTYINAIKKAFPFYDMKDGTFEALEFFKLIFGYLRMLNYMNEWKEFNTDGKQ